MTLLQKLIVFAHLAQDWTFFPRLSSFPVVSFQMGEELLFLKAVSLCHTVQISYDTPDCLGVGGDPFSHANGFSSNQMEYYASSPDEKALVEATKR